MHSGVSQCCFNMCFPDDIWCKDLFILIFSICIPSLVSCLLRSLYHLKKKQIFFKLLNFKSSLNILFNGSLSDVSFPNMFSQSVACLLLLLILSVLVQKFLILIKFSLLDFSFIDCVFVIVSKKHHNIQGDQGFLLCYLLGVI